MLKIIIKIRIISILQMPINFIHEDLETHRFRTTMDEAIS